MSHSLIDLVRPVWRRLPLTIRTRQHIQQTLFRLLPFVFRHHPAFRDRRRQLGVGAAAAGSAQPLIATEPPRQLPVRLIAFYLPQYHPIPENDAWWGRGFTEWTNVVRAKPRFPGHYQPHLPGELGFYDLRVPEVVTRQVELARLHGVSGFAFYYYWFDGRRLLERPLEAYLANGPDFPFCLCWANESWSRRWDGRADEILMAQRHSAADDLAFIQDVARYVRDPRYLRVGDRPLLLIYRPALFPDPAETAARWRTWCRDAGIGEICLGYVQSFESDPPSRYGFDVAVEFPPNNSHPVEITREVAGLDPDFAGAIYDWTRYPERSRNYAPCDYPLFRGVNPGWDNEARRPGRGTLFLGATPDGYREWLENAILDTLERFAEPSERLVFINAWNEWAEGAHLEPDARHGYAYLQATRDALTGALRRQRREILLVVHDALPHGAQYLALRMVQRLHEDLGYQVTVVALGDGPLLAAFAAVATVEQLAASSAAHGPGQRLARLLYQRGIRDAIVNSTASGRFVPALKSAGFRVLALVHELPQLIRQLDLTRHARLIAAQADALVFPAQAVADGFASLVALPAARTHIRPQGLYKRNQLVTRLPRAQIRAQLRQRLGVAETAPILLGVGYGDHRKGLDLFVDVLLRLAVVRDHCIGVWVGNQEPELGRAVTAAIAAAGAQARFRFIGHTPDTDLFFAGADVYALTSREDPFPSVVLESLEVAVPVVAFAGCGGFAELAPDGGVTLVPAADCAAFSAAVGRLLDAELLRQTQGAQGRARVQRDFGFQRYLLDLLALTTRPLPRVSVIVPNYNYARYLPARIQSILSQTLPFYELILLDDASTDGSRAWLEDALPRLAPEAQVVLRAVNSGSVFQQWLAGVELARGDLVWIAEADDLAHPELLQELVPRLAEPGVVLSYCQSRQIDEHGHLLCPDYLDYLADLSAKRWHQAYVRDGLEEIREVLAVKNSIPNVSALVFRREPLLEVLRTRQTRLRDYAVAGDWLVYVELLRQGAIAYSPRALNDHRRHRQGVTLGSFNLSQLKEIRAMQDWIAAEFDPAPEIRARADAYLQQLYLQFGLASPQAPSYRDHPELRRR